jgi:hypothetical protein
MPSYPSYFEFSWVNYSPYSRSLPSILLNHSWDSPISFLCPQSFLFRQFISFFIPYPLFSIPYDILDDSFLLFSYDPASTFLPPFRLSS